MIDRQGDREVIHALRHHHSDISKPHHTLHYFYFNSKAHAKNLAAELQNLDCFNIRVEAAKTPFFKRLLGSQNWSCVAEKTLIPSEENVFANTDQFNTLASKYNGEYDGWEADIVH